MTARLLPALLITTALAASPAHAQDSRALQDLQRQVRELRAIVFQGRDTGQPVEVKPVGPDPQVTALEEKVNGLEQQLRAQTGQMEVMGHDLDEARRAAEQLRAENASRRQAVDDRLARLEAAQAAAAAPPPAATATYEPPPEAPPPAARRPNGRPDVTGRAQAEDTSRFGEAAASGGDGFAEAYQHLSDADYAGAQAGFEGWLAANPTSPRAGEGRYYLGQSLYGQTSYTPAARAYAEALKGWPKAKWAPDATVKLAQSLQALGRAQQACAALGEFDRRYAATAAAAVKTRATATKARANCP